MVNAGRTAWDSTGMPPQFFDSNVNPIGPAGGFGYRDSQGRVFNIPGAGPTPAGAPPAMASSLPQGPQPAPVGGAGLAMALSGPGPDDFARPQAPAGFAGAARLGAKPGQPAVAGGAGLARALASIGGGR